MTSPSAQTVDRFECLGIRIEEIFVGPGEELPWHEHEALYIDFWMSGRMEGSWHDDTACHTLSLLPPGFRHRSRSLSPVRTLQVVVTPSEVRRLQDSIGPCWGPIVFESSYPVHVAHRLFRAFKSRDDLAELDLGSHLADLWHSAVGARARPDAGARWLSRLEELLRETYMSPISADAIAAQIGIDRSHMMREFRKARRQTMGGFVRSLRVEEACHLMRRGDQTFAEIAHTVGFADQSHMNRTMREALGVSPTEYARGVR